MKTSAGIFFNWRRAKGERRKTANLAFYLLPFAICLSSCSIARYEVSKEPVQQPVEKKVETVTEKLVEKQAEKPAAKPVEKKQPLVFQEYKESKGERKKIVASWYGSDFHGRPTSSGELFNMHALTCAHKEYPFGTKLKVVNPKNDKEVECTVNDRGPFIPGRDLDLSYASAKKIDLVGPGTGHVMIEPLGRDLRYVKYIRYGATEGALTIQVGSFRDEANAKRLKMALEINHQNVYMIEANVGGSKYYRVRIGKFNNRADAHKTGSALAEEGYNVLITKFEQQI
jgi:rare lipoprotein A